MHAQTEQQSNIYIPITETNRLFEIKYYTLSLCLCLLNCYVKELWNRIIKLLMQHTHYSITYPETQIFPLSDQVKKCYLLRKRLMRATVIYSMLLPVMPVKADQPALFDNISIEVLLKCIVLVLI
jgi:hypothetical protein